MSTKKTALVLAGALLLAVLPGCGQPPAAAPAEGRTAANIATYVDDLADLDMSKPYSLVYTSKVEVADAVKEFKKVNPNSPVLYQSSLVYLPDALVPIMRATTGKEITERMWLKGTDGRRVTYDLAPFGLDFDAYAIDIRQQEARGILAEHFAKMLQVAPYFDGLFFDVVEDRSRSVAITDEQWQEATAMLLEEIRQKIGRQPLILVNGGYYSPETPFLKHVNGYNLEYFLTGSQEHGLGAASSLAAMRAIRQNCQAPHYLILNPKETSQENLRLVLALSLLHDEAYVHYAPGTWEEDFSAQLGAPLGEYSTSEDGTYRREFSNGTVIADLKKGEGTISIGQ